MGGSSSNQNITVTTEKEINTKQKVTQAITNMFCMG